MSNQPSQELVEQFVIAAHFNLPRVKELYEQHPELLNEKWAKFDESALAAASINQIVERRWRATARHSKWRSTRVSWSVRKDDVTCPAVYSRLSRF